MTLPAPSPGVPGGAVPLALPPGRGDDHLLLQGGEHQWTGQGRLVRAGKEQKEQGKEQWEQGKEQQEQGKEQQEQEKEKQEQEQEGSRHTWR